MGQLIHHNIKQSLKINPTSPPIKKMLQISLSSLTPLAIGMTNDHFGYSVFGALFSLAMALNDHQGQLKNRIRHLVTCSFFLNLGLFLGAFFKNYEAFVPLLILVLAFILGKIKDQGIELERMYLFSLFNFIAIFDSVTNLNQIFLPLIYSCIGVISYLFILLLLNIFIKDFSTTFRSKRNILKNSLQNKSNTRFSIIYSLTVTLSFYFFKFLQFKHSYWIAGTILIVMLPSFAQSFDKSIQRVIGTLLGVIIASTMLNFIHFPFLILVGILAFIFFIPWMIELNYWLANVFIAALVIFISEAQFPSLDILSVSLERVIDITIGGFIAIFVNYFFLKKEH